MRTRAHKARRWRRSGWALLFIFVAMMFAAWNTGANLWYVVLGGLASFAVLSAFLSRWNLVGVGVKCTGPETVHRTQPFYVDARIENHRKVLPALSIRIEDRSGAATAYVPVIPARRGAALQFTQRCDVRGVQVLPQLSVATSFPFGLVEVRRTIRDALTITVYPRLIPLRADVRDLLAASGEQVARTAGDSNEYFCLREYVSGDDVRRLAWKASARLRKWLVRENQAETTRRLLFVFDTRVPADLEEVESRFEDAVEVVASLAAASLREQYHVAILTPARSLPLGSGKAHEIAVLEFLTRVVPDVLESGSVFEPLMTHEYDAGLAVIRISADPAQWGRGGTRLRGSVLDLGALIHA